MEINKGNPGASPVAQWKGICLPMRRHRFNPWVGKTEEGMAVHSSILAWSIPWTEKAGGLPSIGSQRVRHDLAHRNATIA